MAAEVTHSNTDAKYAIALAVVQAVFEIFVVKY